ncbi:hypothetical protein CU669_13545 [Paramagnetospirillum kuznetsovii]|uniref:STAS domain-containing protein n=1 Tax=Paramagnetospirillum kuznetsovii TaxID=2053833 RepID=A0A364NX15_9PROT|nr:STAS domain-containing protein [Paramagnetospirillum kuznetsovii]RAU21445.1 hypothetical protein CU669_13545 [Paramagnetospirillum kuznetsovii]
MTNITYGIKTTATGTEINLIGRLTFTEASVFSAILGELASSNKERWDFHVGQLDFIDSTGMSLFVHIYDAAAADKTKVVIHGAAGMVRAALERAAFHTLFELK